jgi:hypothetical protein
MTITAARQELILASDTKAIVPRLMRESSRRALPVVAPKGGTGQALLSGAPSEAVLWLHPDHPTAAAPSVRDPLHLYAQTFGEPLSWPKGMLLDVLA